MSIILDVPQVDCNISSCNKRIIASRHDIHSMKTFIHDIMTYERYFDKNTIDGLFNVSYKLHQIIQNPLNHSFKDSVYMIYDVVSSAIIWSRNPQTCLECTSMYKDFCCGSHSHISRNENIQRIITDLNKIILGIEWIESNM
jgi:hypothetical protein